ncbi:Ldh family oxidoreductase [Devosia sp.]|uniref:Ldh family oxidoreductase n=1 Tax=Devosia sp. TaxID=1871048 RepID=UPI0037C1AC48
MTVRLPFDDLVALLAAIFRNGGCSAAVADILAQNMAAAERDGARSHGVFRVAGYLGSLASGWVDGKVEPIVEDVAPGFIRVDGRNGFALPALAAARNQLIAKARANGIALLAIRNSHHFSALWPDVEPFARDGLIAIEMVNSMASVVPHGGNRKLYGTNPLGFAAPRLAGDPLVFDQASSAIANGDVQIAAREGHDLPPGFGVDSTGAPTTDPKAVLNGGALLPFGGYKGSSIAMMMEIMAAALAGGNFSFEVDFSQHPGAATPHSAQTIIVIDPNIGAKGDFAARIEVLVGELHAAGQDRLPGDRRYANRREAMALGVPLSDDELAYLRKLAGPS